jgi:hypothetical protein
VRLLGRFLFLCGLALAFVFVVLESGCAHRRQSKPADHPCCPGEPCPEEHPGFQRYLGR